MARISSTKTKPRPKSKAKSAKAKIKRAKTPAVASRRRKRRPSSVVFAAVGLALVVAGWGVMTQLPEATGRGISTGYPQKLRTDYNQLNHDVGQFEDMQSKHDASLVSNQSLQNQLSVIQLAAAGGHFVTAESNIRQLEQSLKSWRDQLNAPHPTPTPSPALAQVYSQPPAGTFLPILIYHYTPGDFDAELNYLEQQHYTVIGLDAAAAALGGKGKLPAKPVVLTFDDGFENQMQAFDILKAHHMKATFYIINGGAMSRWCIGAGRRYGDPLQPSSGCGDAYLSWDQVRQLDESGLITIGGHTLDHPDLTSLSADDQRREIIDSKAQIEAEIGHPIYDFAYPYGDYNDTTIGITRSAGYRTAVTTLSGDYQTADGLYTLKRVRTTFDLP